MRTLALLSSGFVVFSVAATSYAGDIINIGVGPLVSVGAAATTGLQPGDIKNAATGSGGLDSGAITAFAAKNSAQAVKTFSPPMMLVSTAGNGFEMVS